MRLTLILLSILYSLTLCLPMASPDPDPDTNSILASNPGSRKGPARIGVNLMVTGMEEAAKSDELFDKSAGGVETKFLITLSKTIRETDKKVILDLLNDKGAFIDQVYNYRIYKGILFTSLGSDGETKKWWEYVYPAPGGHKKDLNWWQNSLGSLEGVKSIEEDRVIKISREKE